MSTMLPTDLSGRKQEGLERAKNELDRRLAPLFRRWPQLSKLELAELHCLYDERRRLARHSGTHRSGLRRAEEKGRTVM